MLDASYHRSCTPSDKKQLQTTFHSNKINQLNCIFWICLCVLSGLLVLASPKFAAAQTPDSKRFELDHDDFEVSVARLKIPSKVWPHLQSAHKELGKGNLERADAEADRALRIDPQCAPALSMKAFIELAARNPSAAVQHATEATRIDLDDARAFVALAMANNASGAFSESQHAAREALKIRPDAWDARLELAKGLYGQGQWNEALVAVNAIDKDFPDIHLLKGNVFMSLGRRLEGAAEFARFLDEAPNDRRVEQIKKILREIRDAQPNL